MGCKKFLNFTQETFFIHNGLPGSGIWEIPRKITIFCVKLKNCL